MSFHPRFSHIRGPAFRGHSGLHHHLYILLYHFVLAETVTGHFDEGEKEYAPHRRTDMYS